MWHATTTCSEACSDGGCGTFPSCLAAGPGAGNDCGGSGGDAGTHDCCASFEVAGGTFDRSYDGVSTGYVNPGFPATVSGFRLDAYEATVGRFRSFVSAVVGGWRPDAGSGKHAYLNGGSGLANVGVDAGAFEPGWSTSWSSNLDSSAASWNTDLACPSATWTASAGADEHRPINCVTWYEAYAFCIWDGGFLPSEAEWNYAASGGERAAGLPLVGSRRTSATIDCAHANYSPTGTPACSTTGPNDVGSESPTGDGKYGQADLAGNVWEWTLDSNDVPYVTPCSDCSNVAPLTSPVTRGGSYGVVAFSAADVVPHHVHPGDARRLRRRALRAQSLIETDPASKRPTPGRQLQGRFRIAHPHVVLFLQHLSATAGSWGTTTSCTCSSRSGR